MGEFAPAGMAVAERIQVSNEGLAALTSVVHALAPGVYDAYAGKHGLDPATLHQRQECEGLSEAMLEALAGHGLHPRIREFDGPAPADRHFFLGWRDVVIDLTWQLSVEDRTADERATMPRALVCRSSELEERLTGFGVPKHKLNRWLDARDHPQRVGMRIWT